LARHALEAGRDRGPRAGYQRENQDEGGDAAHGNLLGGQAADLTAGRAVDASGRGCGGLRATDWLGAEPGPGYNPAPPWTPSRGGSPVTRSPSWSRTWS